MDGNRGVRAEACHVTASLATAVGRGIAPLLKSLLPPLWLAQHDGYSEAAAAAQGALAAAFPTVAKQRDALLFCRAEVRPALWVVGWKGGCCCCTSALDILILLCTVYHSTLHAKPHMHQ